MGYKGWRENSTNILERDKALRSLQKGCIPEVNLEELG